MFDADQVEDIRRIYYEQGTGPGGPWDPFRHAHMRLPSWFTQGLDPYSDAYKAQQHRLWSLITGVDRPYDVEADEKDVWTGNVDAVRFPGFYSRRDELAVSTAADHVLATGMLLQQSGLKPGDWALEYGAGFGQSALALARLGVNVDTVDVSPRFCSFVQAQADYFAVPLTPFVGRFGLQPREDQRYRLIWFYESFHHCVDFLAVVSGLPGLLAPGGRVILGGEPIVESEYEAVPYPWGVRLHSEVTSVMRQTRWFELGFSEAFIFDLFSRAGFSGRRVECPSSLFGRLWIFELEQAA